MSSSERNHQDKSKSVGDYLKKADYIVDQRFLHFAFNCLGKNVEVQLDNGSKAQGRFFTSHLDGGEVVLKNFNLGDNQKEIIPMKILHKEDFVYMLAKDVEEPPLISSQKNELKTDAEISKKHKLDERKLVKWSAEDNAAEELGGKGQSLEEFAAQSGKWDQFEMNKKRFGLNSGFREDMYTTSLDMKNVSAALLEKATRIEAEILNQASDYGNRHIREERGLEGLKEADDEEAAYSSVVRTKSKPANEKPAAAGKPDEARPKFFNSKKNQPAATAANQTLETNGTNNLSVPTSTTSNTIPEKLPTNVNSGNTNRAEAFSQNQITKIDLGKVAGDDNQTGNQDKVLMKQSSNISEGGSSKSKPLSTKAISFQVTPTSKPQEQTPKEEQKQKEETPQTAQPKPAPVKTEPEIQFNKNDYNSTAISKFKLKINEVEIKKSNKPFFDSWVHLFLEKENPQPPSAIDPNWKIAKEKAESLRKAKISANQQPPKTFKDSGARPPQNKYNPTAFPYGGGGNMPMNPMGYQMPQMMYGMDMAMGMQGYPNQFAGMPYQNIGGMPFQQQNMGMGYQQPGGMHGFMPNNFKSGPPQHYNKKY